MPGGNIIELPATAGYGNSSWTAVMHSPSAGQEVEKAGKLTLRKQDKEKDARYRQSEDTGCNACASNTAFAELADTV